MLVYAPHLPTNAEHRKHLMAWKGPFFVSKEIASDVFEVLGMGPEIPTAYHRSKLKRYQRPDSQQSRLFPSPAPLKFVDGQVEYEVEEVLDHREVRSKRQSTCFNGRILRKPRGNGNPTLEDVWTY